MRPTDLVYDFSFPSYARFREGTRPMPQKVFPHPTVRAPSASNSPSALSARALRAGWRTIWHRTQFGTGPNLAPRVLWGQFGTKSVKESIWHRTQFGTKSVKGVNLAPESIWHRTNLAPRVQKSQFGTGVNLAPYKWNIFHYSEHDTIQTLTKLPRHEGNSTILKIWQ